MCSRMRTTSESHTDRLTRKAERALTVVTILGVIEILRRTPRWLLLLALVLVLLAVAYALAYLVWVVAALGALVAWKVGRGVLRGWTETR